jgi:hypothetical protein
MSWVINRTNGSVALAWLMVKSRNGLVDDARTWRGGIPGGREAKHRGGVREEIA